MALSGLAFMALFLGALAMAFIRSPMYGLYAYLAAFYVHPPSRWWGAALPDLRWSLLAGVVMFAAVMAKKPPAGERSVFKYPPVIVLIMFTIWTWLQTPWALFTDLHIGFAILFSKYIVLVFSLHRILQTEEDLRNFLLANVLGCGYLGYLAWQAGGGGRLEGVGGPGISEANSLGMQLGVGIMFASMLLLTLPRKLWPLVLLPIPLMANGLVQTQSRSAFLAFVVGGIALWYLKPPKRSKLFYTFAALAIAGFLVAAGAFYWERIRTIEAAVDDNAEMDKSAASRIVIALAQLEMFKAYPFGAGHRGTAALSPFYIPEEYLTTSSGSDSGARSSHNTFLAVLVEQGIPGALMFLAAVLWAARSLLRLRRADKAGLPATLGAYRAAAGAGLVVVLVAGLFVDYLKAEVQVWCLAILLSLERIVERDYGLGVRAKPRLGDKEPKHRPVGAAMPHSSSTGGSHDQVIGARHTACTDETPSDSRVSQQGNRALL